MGASNWWPGRRPSKTRERHDFASSKVQKGGYKVINEIFLNNFQGFGENTQTEVGQLTLIFGPNASGKSSIGRALKVMKQSAVDTNVRPGHVWKGSEVDLGSAKNAIRGQLDRKGGPTHVFLGLTIERLNAPPPLSNEAVTPAASIAVSEDVRDSSLKIDLISWQPKVSRVVSYIQNSAGWSVSQAYEIGALGKDPDEEVLDRYQVAMETLKPYISVVGNRFQFNAPDDYYDLFEDHFTEYGAENGDVEKFFQATYEATELFLAELTGLSFIAPIRPVPPKFEVFESEEEFYEIESKLRADSLKRTQSLMLKLTGGRYSSQVRVYREPNSGANVRVNVIEDLNSGAKLGFDQVGMGLSQISPIIEDITSGAGATYIEQPELHLHPKMQGDLMDAFIETVNTEPSRQFLLETHSETMLLRAQKRVREGQLDPEKLKILFVNEAIHDDGTKFNSIQVLKLDEAGDFLDPLPLSFMNLRMQDLL